MELWEIMVPDIRFGINDDSRLQERSTRDLRSRLMLKYRSLIAFLIFMNVQTFEILECASKTKGDFMNNEMLFIPRSNFIMGLSKEQTEAVVAEFTPASAMISPFLFYLEAPEHSVKLPDLTSRNMKSRMKNTRNLSMMAATKEKNCGKNSLKLAT